MDPYVLTTLFFVFFSTSTNTGDGACPGAEGQ